MNAEQLRALPKVDLHRHLEGSLRLETLWDFHRHTKQTMHQSFAALKNACTVPAGARPGFAGFLARFSGLRFHYGGVAALERIAAEAAADAAADGVVHLELRFSPIFCALRLRPDSSAKAQMDPAAVLVAEAEHAAEAVVRGARAEAKRCGISVAFVITLGRHYGAAFNKAAASLLHRPVGRALAGLDLAGDESFASDEFAPFFRAWKAAGRGITIHAGEDPGGAGAENVRSALALGADRIGHGVQAIRDAKLVALLARKKTVLEMCPTSNVQTRAARSFRDHPLKRLLAAGVRATIASDDPAISQTRLSLEYFRTARYCGLHAAELRVCAVNAARGAFLPDAQKAILVKRIEQAWGTLSNR